MDQDKINILRIFQLDGTPVSCEDYGSGHVNVTFLVVTDTGRRYILQKINHHAFRNVQALSENIAAVTDFLRSKSSDPRSVMSLIRTKDGAPHTRYGDEYWRVYDYVDGTICLQKPETDEDFYQAAVGFGTFAQLLSDFPAEKLHETIPNFHNTPDRCRLFREAIERDAVGRAAAVQPEIDFALAREAEMSILQNLLSAGEIPLRVTHNDTKLNNVLLDAKTRKALCVVDLDTVMPGSSLFDFGDAIRYGASTLQGGNESGALPRFHARICPCLPESDRQGTGAPSAGGENNNVGVRHAVSDRPYRRRSVLCRPPRRAES